MVIPGANPAARVYESIGSDFFLAVAPGWQVGLLWRRQIIDYVLLRAVRP